MIETLLRSKTTASNHKFLPTVFLKPPGQLIIRSTYKCNGYLPIGLMEDTSPRISEYGYGYLTLHFQTLGFEKFNGHFST